MARKHMAGQLNIFDLLNNWDGPAMGEEVEMVSLMPEVEDEVEPAAETQDKQEPQIEPEFPSKKEKQVEKSSKSVESKVRVPATQEEPKEEYIETPTPAKKRKPTNFNEKVIMHRKYKTSKGEVDIAYLSYNKVRIRVAGEEDQVMEFATSKEAVDYYVDRMQGMEEAGEE